MKTSLRPSSLPTTVRSRADRLQERIWISEQQIRERDQKIAHLQMDLAAVRKRCDNLLDAYNKLRWAKMPSVSSSHLSNDTSKNIVKVKERKRGKEGKCKGRERMSENEGVGTTATSAIETESEANSRIVIEAALAASQKRVNELEQREKQFSGELQRSRLEVVNLKGCLFESEAKNAVLRSKLDRANAVIGSMGETLVAKDNRLCAALIKFGH